MTAAFGFGQQAWPVGPTMPSAPPAGYVAPSSPANPGGGEPPMTQEQIQAYRQQFIELIIRTVLQVVQGFIPFIGQGQSALPFLQQFFGSLLGQDFLGGSWQDLIDGLFGAATGDENASGIPFLDLIPVLPQLLNMFSSLDSDRLFGLIPFDVLGGELPLSDLFNSIPQLLVDPFFQFAESILGGDIWNFDDTTTDGDSNSVTLTADGTINELFGNPIRVSEGQEVAGSVRTKWAGLTGSGSPIQLVLALFNGQTLVNEILLDSQPFSTAGGFVELSGTETIPAGVNKASMKLAVTDTATGGNVWFANPSLTKPLVPDLWADQLGLSGVWDILSSIFSGEIVSGNILADVLTLGLSFFDILGGGGGSNLDDIFDRFFHLGQNGIFDAVGIGNVNSLSPITNDSVVPGLGLLRGVLGGGATLGGSGGTFDLASIFDVFTRNAEQSTQLSAAVNEMLTTQIETSTSGVRALETFEYVDNDSLAETLWDAQWLSGNNSQARIAVVDGHNAGMEYISGSNIIELCRYQGPDRLTETTYQRVAVVIHTPMASGSENHVYMRMSTDKTKWVRWNYSTTTVKLEYKNGGAITQLGTTATIFNAPVAAILAGLAGTDGGERAFEAFIGRQRVHTVTDVSAVTALEKGGGWGQKWGSATAGKVTQFTLSDNVPVPILGTTIRVFRATTTGITKGGGTGPIPANTFDTVDYISTDITWNAVTSTATLTKPGTYLFSGRFEMSNPIGFSEELYPTIIVNGVDRIRGGARRGITASAFGFPHFPQDRSAGGDPMLLYCAAGTTVQFGFFATQSNTVIGDAAGGKTWFSAVRIV